MMKDIQELRGWNLHSLKVRVGHVSHAAAAAAAAAAML